MTTIKTLFAVSIVIIASACATAPPVPVAVDMSAPALFETEEMLATLRVVPDSEADALFGHGTAARLGVVELRVQNRGALAASVNRKQIRFVTPEEKEVRAMSPLGVASTTRGTAPTSTGINAVDAVQLVLALATLAHNHEIAAKWDHLMPSTFKVAAGGERRMLLAFPTPDWAPGVWRLELSFDTDAGTAGPQLSIPLLFKAIARPQVSGPHQHSSRPFPVDPLGQDVDTLR